MLSRVAETLYWLGRYVERAENAARIVTVNANLLLDLPRGTALGWEPLIAITGSENLTRLSKMPVSGIQRTVCSTLPP